MNGIERVTANCRSAAAQLVDIFRVPEANREQFISDATKALENAFWSLPWKVSGREFLAAEKAVRAARDAIYRLSPSERWSLWMMSPLFETDKVNPPNEDAEAALWMRQFDDAVATFAAMSGRPPVPQPTGSRRGRRKGEVKDFWLDGLICELWQVVCRHGGPLTFNRKDRRGTIVEALDILKKSPFSDKIPNVLPLTTIERIVKRLRNTP